MEPVQEMYSSELSISSSTDVSDAYVLSPEQMSLGFSVFTDQFSGLVIGNQGKIYITTDDNEN